MVDDAALYVHVPFCARACPYCDFDFVVGRTPPSTPYLAALEEEAEARSVPRRPQTVYVGGGTPSLLGPVGITALFDWIDRRCDRSGALETTVELNPEHVDERLVEALLAARVDRASIGIQSFQGHALRTLGRAHDAVAAKASVRRCRQAGLRVSVDLIVGWPGQSMAALQLDVEQVLALDVQHVSVYALTVEPNTPWMSLVRRGRRRLPQADHQAALLEAAERALQAAGLRHYEISSYAAVGEEALHNTAYWTWRDYTGLGPSAASAAFAEDGSVARRTNRRGFDAWSDDPIGSARFERLDAVAAAAEGLWTGLRRLDGLDVDAWLRRFPGVDRAWLDARIERQVGRGNLELADHGRRLRVARQRWMLHDEICADLLD